MLLIFSTYKSHEHKYLEFLLNLGSIRQFKKLLFVIRKILHFVIVQSKPFVILSFCQAKIFQCGYPV